MATTVTGAVFGSCGPTRRRNLRQGRLQRLAAPVGRRNGCFLPTKIGASFFPNGVGRRGRPRGPIDQRFGEQTGPPRERTFRVLFGSPYDAPAAINGSGATAYAIPHALAITAESTRRYMSPQLSIRAHSVEPLAVLPAGTTVRPRHPRLAPIVVGRRDCRYVDVYGATFRTL